MTQNQIAYQANLERERSNRINEQEAHRSNVARESHNKAALKQAQHQFNRSNWHSAVKNVGQGVGSAAKAVASFFI